MSEIDLSGCILSKGADIVLGVEDLFHRPGPLAVLGCRPDPAGDEIAVDVQTLHFRYVRPPVTIPAGDRTALSAAILDDGKRQAAVVAVGRWIETAGALHQTPTVVFAAGAQCRLEVDLFQGILSDVTDKQVSGLPIEGKSPGIAKAVSPDFIFSRRIRHEWIVRRNAVGKPAVHIDAQDLSKQGGQSLGVVLRVAAVAAVACADIQIAVGAELQLSAVVIAKRLVYLQQNRFRSSVRHIGVGRYAEAR